MPQLEGKTIVITGGSTGIGAASALALAQEGAQVLLTYLRNQELAQQVAQQIQSRGGKAWAMPLDATDPQQMPALVEQARARLGKVDVLFNNAGDLVQRATLEQVTADLLRRILDVNVLSTVLVTQALLPLIPSGGAIINMTSIAARNGGALGSGFYAAAKGAVKTLTRSWAKELAPRGIRVFDVAPGVIRTPFHDRHTSKQFLDWAAASTPMGRLGEAEEVARVVAFLASGGSSFMTGQTIDINGGLYLP